MEQSRFSTSYYRGRRLHTHTHTRTKSVHTYVHKHTYSYKRTFHVVITAYPGVRRVPPSENRIKSESSPTILARSRRGKMKYMNSHTIGGSELSERPLNFSISLSRTTSFTATHHQSCLSRRSCRSKDRPQLCRSSFAPM